MKKIFFAVLAMSVTYSCKAQSGEFPLDNCELIRLSLESKNVDSVLCLSKKNEIVKIYDEDHALPCESILLFGKKVKITTNDDEYRAVHDKVVWVVLDNVKLVNKTYMLIFYYPNSGITIEIKLIKNKLKYEIKTEKFIFYTD